MNRARRKRDKGTTRPKTLDEVVAQYRGQNLVLAVSGSLKVLAKGRAVSGVLRAARKRKEPFFITYSPPSDDKPTIFM